MTTAVGGSHGRSEIGAPTIPVACLLETPGDLEHLVQQLLPLLADGFLVMVDEDGPASQRLELAALLSTSILPDVIDAKFVDQSGQHYQLFVDVFHGSGGRWSRVAGP